MLKIFFDSLHSEKILCTCWPTAQNLSWRRKDCILLIHISFRECILPDVQLPCQAIKVEKLSRESQVYIREFCLVLLPRLKWLKIIQSILNSQSIFYLTSSWEEFFAKFFIMMTKAYILLFNSERHRHLPYWEMMELVTEHKLPLSISWFFLPFLYTWFCLRLDKMNPWKHGLDEQNLIGLPQNEPNPHTWTAAWTCIPSECVQSFLNGSLPYT